MIFLIASVIFSLGFVAGSYFKSVIYDNQSWMVMKWNKEALGFRPVMLGSRVFREDKIVMSLEIDTAQFGDEGAVVE